MRKTVVMGGATLDWVIRGVLLKKWHKSYLKNDKDLDTW